MPIDLELFGYPPLDDPTLPQRTHTHTHTHTHTRLKRRKTTLRGVLSRQQNSRQRALQQRLQLVTVAEGVGSQEVTVLRGRGARRDGEHHVLKEAMRATNCGRAAESVLEGMEGILRLQHTPIWWA